ncbi:hypothetical protein DXG01_004016 [Tephrocybe rancida]|nr:hypothetical protein DXG01_004016 [Tephrocybe rancida]
MVLKFYGYHKSTCCQRVTAVMLEKEVAFKLITVDFASKEHKSPAFLEKQPFGQIPYIDDDGFILYESRAICRYISTKYTDQGTKLIPTDLNENALFEQAASSEQSNFDSPASAAIYENVYKPCVQLPCSTAGRGVSDPTIFEGLIEKLDDKLDVYEKILSKQNGQLTEAGSGIMEREPNVARWFKDISSRLSWVSVKAGITSNP